MSLGLPRSRGSVKSITCQPSVPSFPKEQLYLNELSIFCVSYTQNDEEVPNQMAGNTCATIVLG
jgi:hypothetical protein